MKKTFIYLVFIPLLLSSCISFSQPKDIKHIQTANAHINTIHFHTSWKYKYSPTLEADYSYVEAGDTTLFYNSNTQCFAIRIGKRLYFYNKALGKLYTGTDSSRVAKEAFDTYNLYFLSTHSFMLDLARLLPGVGQYNFESSRAATQKQDKRICFTSLMVNPNMLDVMSNPFKMTKTTRCCYTYDSSTFIVNSFTTTLDSANITGDGIIKTTYQLSEHNNLAFAQPILAYVDSIIGNTKADDFPQYYFFNDYFYPQQKNKRQAADSLAAPYTGIIYSLTGDSSRIGDFKSDFILIDFWFMQCPGCIRGIPHVNKLYKKFDTKQLQIIGVNTQDKQIKAVQDFAQSMEMAYPVYLANRRFATHYEVQYFPSYILIDNRGATPKVMARFDSKAIEEGKIEETLAPYL